MNISVIGCGRWGSFIAWYLHKLQNNVLIYGRENSKTFNQIVTTRDNGLIKFDDDISLSSDLSAAINHAEIIIISINSQNLRDFMKECASIGIKNKTIVLCMKGIEKETGKLLTEIVEEYVDNTVNTAIWVGPGHVQNFINDIPNCMVIDSTNDQTKEMLIKQFSSSLIRFYYGNDIIGNQIGAASKNVIGIAAGMLDGLNRTSLKGALMSRGTREISKLIKAMGGNEFTAYGLSHLGDYEATVFSEYSHNRKFGEMYIKGEPYDQLAEGVDTAKSIIKLSEIYNVELPICNAVYQVLNFNKDPKEILYNLFLRSLKVEFNSN